MNIVSATIWMMAAMMWVVGLFISAIAWCFVSVAVEAVRQVAHLLRNPPTKN